MINRYSVVLIIIIIAVFTYVLLPGRTIVESFLITCGFLTSSWFVAFLFVNAL